MTPDRRPVLALGVTVAALSTLVSPLTAAVGDDGADARVRTTVPAIHMDTTAVRPVTAPGGSTLDLLGATATQIAPMKISVTPKAPLTPQELPALLTDGRIGVDLFWGPGDCDAVRWAVEPGSFGKDATAVPTPSDRAAEMLRPEAQPHVCTRLASSLRREELVQRHAGRRFVVTTTWRSSTPPPATWSSTASTRALLTIPLPPPVAATTSACTARGGAASLTWAWPSAGATPLKGAAGISRWDVLARPAGGTAAWTKVGSSTGGARRTAPVTPAALRTAGITSGAVEVMIRALPFEKDASAYADSADVWGLTLGAKGLTCGDVGRNPSPRTSFEASR